MLKNPHAIVEIDGFTWDSWIHKRLFERVSIELTTNEASEGVWQTFDPNFRLLNRYTKDDGVPMAVMRFFLGTGPDLGPPLFKGLLARVERGDSSTAFRAYDMGFKMRLVKKTEHHSGSDVAIMEKLATRNGLQFVGPTAEELKDAPKVPAHKAMTQDQQTDWEHAMERAEAAGLVLFVRDDTLFAKPPGKTAPDGQEKIVLTYRKDFTILHPLDLICKTPENVAGRPKEVHVRGRKRGGKRLTGTAAGGSRGHKQLSLKTDLPTHLESVAKSRAHASRELQREHAYTVSIRTISPLPKVRPDVRDTIRLMEAGKLFSGKYLADRVSHDLTPGQLATSYQLYRDVKEQ